ncbi:M13 family metallopeptidase [Streptomyces coacervatus]|uniref:M13 family metallopeptidase n=1 Tax=Streptomyces coacervatus TaxID=647381 RepID=A0ABP7JDU5_9ACTN|nr:M13 family metallopeptidase [Streptomyces coacervatus]MDF2273407.1 M13 family metallopeptidase [Streptomyces coacervatus]
MSDADTAYDVDTDPAIRPQDDFYGHVNGRWADAFVLPEHRAEATMLSLLAEKVQDDVVAVIRDAPSPAAPGGPGRQIADLYASFMDEAGIEERGPADLAALLGTIRAVADRAELARLMGRLQREGVGGPVEATVATDTAGTRGYLLTVTQSGLALSGGVAAYLDAAGAPLREQYAEHLRRMLELAGQPDPGHAADAALRVETALAAAHTPPDASGRIKAEAHVCTAAELAADEGDFPWGAWLEGLGDIPADAVVQVRPGPFRAALEAWWTATDLEDLKLWLIWLQVHEAAPFGTAAMFTENFRFYGQVLTGSRRPRPRWMRATSFVQTVLGDEVGAHYLKEHLEPGTRKAAEDLVDELVRAYRGCLEQAGWMADSTRASALAKLDAMHFELGHPQDDAVHEELHTDPADLLGNVRRGRTRRFVRQLRRLGGPVDRTEWKVPPQAVTAYYRHGLNQVVVPAALLQPPLFDAGGDMTRNFALLGSIVCHEMSHAFDSRGSRYDGEGRLREWWSEADRAEYTRRTALLVEQYDRYVPEGLDGQHVSGARTVGENIADITGLTVAHAAFTAHLAATGRTDAEQAAENRRFFVLWASMWRAKRTPGRMRERLAGDRHAPPQFRCNGSLGHIPAFHRAFDVSENDPMSIPAAARFTLL